MKQQISSFQRMSNFVRSDGLYTCEDLATSYARSIGGKRRASLDDAEFRNDTMLGRISHSITWLHAGFWDGKPGKTTETSADRPQNVYPHYPAYNNFLCDFKSIHVNNQIVFYKRGTYNQKPVKTKGVKIAYKSGNYSGYRLPWDKVENEMGAILKRDALKCT